jgi:hypothetical protein
LKLTYWYLLPGAKESLWPSSYSIAWTQLGGLCSPSARSAGPESAVGSVASSKPVVMVRISPSVISLTRGSTGAAPWGPRSDERTVANGFIASESFPSSTSSQATAAVSDLETLPSRNIVVGVAFCLVARSA